MLKKHSGTESQKPLPGLKSCDSAMTSTQLGAEMTVETLRIWKPSVKLALKSLIYRLERNTECFFVAGPLWQSVRLSRWLSFSQRWKRRHRKVQKSWGRSFGLFFFSLHLCRPWSQRWSRPLAQLFSGTRRPQLSRLVLQPPTEPTYMKTKKQHPISLSQKSNYHNSSIM